MKDMSDEEIASEVQNGKEDVFGMLIERYETKLRRYARRFLLEKEDAEDVLQEVFIKAYVNIKSFDTSRKFSSWIYRIAHNEFINAIQKRGRFPSISLDPDTIFPHPVAKETADKPAELKELKELLQNYLTQIDVKYREPLILYYFEELDYKEISEILQIPVSTVGVRLSRGKTALKNLVGKIEI